MTGYSGWPAVVGLEAAAASLIGPGDVVLNLVSGVFGRAFGRTARPYAGEIIEIEVGYDSAVPAGRVHDALRDRPDISIVSVVHCETPCGTVNDIGAISAAMDGHDALLLVDAVSTFGGTRCDVAVAARPGRGRPAEVPRGPPGLSLLHRPRPARRGPTSGLWACASGRPTRRSARMRLGEDSMVTGRYSRMPAEKASWHRISRRGVRCRANHCRKHHVLGLAPQSCAALR